MIFNIACGFDFAQEFIEQWERVSHLRIFEIDRDRRITKATRFDAVICEANDKPSGAGPLRKGWQAQPNQQTKGEAQQRHEGTRNHFSFPLRIPVEGLESCNVYSHKSEKCAEIDKLRRLLIIQDESADERN